MDFPKTPKIPLTADPRLMIIFSKPKQGKTTSLSLLPNNLILDLEEGSDHVGGLTMKANSFKELVEIKNAMIEQEIVYDYITIDTTTALEDYACDLAKIMYQNTPMGKDWGKPDKNGKIKSGQDHILKLPNGAGYLYLRDAFQAIVKGFKPFAKKCVILSGHVNDKLVNKNGEEVTEMQLDLAGKLARIMYSKADAVGLLYRKDNKVFLNFNGGGDAIIEARTEHLAGKEILLTEKVEGKIIANWDKVFLELNK